MGIPKFNKWLSRKVRITNTQGVYFDRLPKKVSSLSFDLNGIIHRARQIVYGLTEDTLPGYRETLKTMKPREILKKVFNTVCLILSETTLMVAPSDTVVITIDGVTNMAKIKQQRGRRYNSASSEYAGQPDSCEVTPGTMFMLKLDLYLRKWLEDNRQFFPPTLIYSSHLDPGEGEHKIMSFFRQGKVKGNGFHMVYGLDGDLILLSMLSPQDNIVLIREDMSKLISINGVKKMLIDFAPIKLKETAVPDFVAMMSLIGNDFIPHGHLHDSMFERIEAMLREYHRQNLPVTEKTKSVRIINLGNLVNIANQMGNVDITQTSIEAVEQLSNSKNYHPNRFYNISITEESVVGKTNIKRKVFDYSRFRSAWYNNELYIPGGIPGISQDIPASQAEIEDMCRKYIEGIVWVFRYYQTIHVDSYWYYPYSHPPLMKDLAVILRNLPALTGVDLNNKFRQEFKLQHGPLEQLLMVIPYSNRDNNVPTFLHSLYESNSDYVHMFPRAFRLELDGLGLNESYLATPILPMFDYREIIKATSKFQLKIWQPRASELIRTNDDAMKSYINLSETKRREYENENNRRMRNLKSNQNQNLQQRAMTTREKSKETSVQNKTIQSKEPESYDINTANIQKVDDFVLVQDSALKYGTKMRLLPYFLALKSSGITEIATVGSSHSYGQTATAWCCKEAGLKCIIFINKDRKRSYMTLESIRLGAEVMEIEPSPNEKKVKMSELTKIVENYKPGDKSVSRLPTIMYPDNAMRALVENIRNIGFKYNLNPRRIWVAGGTGFIAGSLARVFPNAQILIVEVGLPVKKDFLHGVNYKTFKYPIGEYKDPTVEPPPYQSLANYDAKVWYFAKRMGHPGDMIWNVK